MKNAKLYFFDGQTAVHIIGPFQLDVSLCGHDLNGDSGTRATGGGGYNDAELTNEKCDCPDCLMIVKYCKIINVNRQFTKTKRIE